MCGIAGLVMNAALQVDEKLVSTILQGMEHRGPDDAGWLTLSGGRVRSGRVPEGTGPVEAALFHRRLSILDLTDGGRQPMSTADGRFHMVFNGEIYNFVELKAELEKLGDVFKSVSDTEVLLAAYARWGSSALSRMTGMFALGILDIRERSVFLARDFFGIKPLYYTWWRNGLAFASEIRTLLELPGVVRKTNPQRLFDYLRFGLTDHGEETMFDRIYQLPPAHFAMVSLDRPSIVCPEKFWSPGGRTEKDISIEEAARRLRELFLESVRLHLRSDVPVGTALSGGVDSSSIMAGMRQVSPDAELHGFSYVADLPAINEEKWVDMAGEAARATVHKTAPVPEDLEADLERLIEVQDEPFGSLSIYAQYRVFRLASQHGVKVMLDGQGADELLAGYHPYLSARLASLVRQRRFVEMARFLRAAAGLPDSSASSVLTGSMNYLLPARMQDPLRRLIGKELTPGWLDMKWFQERRVNCSRGVNYSGSREVLRESLVSSVETSSLPHLLRYEDRNSMAFSIESRVPFLTPALAEFACALPEDMLVARDGTTKAVFRKAMRGLVPDAILDRKDKIGFAVPDRLWLLRLEKWVDGILGSRVAESIPALRPDRVREEWKGIVAGRRRFDWRVWRWVNLIEWVRKYDVSVA